MKEIEEISPIRMSYYYDSEFAPEPAKQLMDFFNSYASMGDMVDLDLYLNTPGGSMAEFNVIKGLLERSSFNITIINSYDMSSYGFVLLYTCKNVNKILTPHCSATLHCISAPFEDRDVKKNDHWMKTRRKILDVANNEFLTLLKSNKLLSISDIKKIEQGDDVILTYDQLHKIMLKCPYGTYINN